LAKLKDEVGKGKRRVGIKNSKQKRREGDGDEAPKKDRRARQKWTACSGVGFVKDPAIQSHFGRKGGMPTGLQGLECENRGLGGTTREREGPSNAKLGWVTNNKAGGGSEKKNDRTLRGHELRKGTQFGQDAGGTKNQGRKTEPLNMSGKMQTERPKRTSETLDKMCRGGGGTPGGGGKSMWKKLQAQKRGQHGKRIGK